MLTLFERSFSLNATMGYRPGPPPFSSHSSLEKASAQVQLVRDNGETILLGKVKDKADVDGHLGIEVADLPVAIQQGDLLLWTVKLKGFGTLESGEDFEILTGIGRPEMFGNQSLVTALAGIQSRPGILVQPGKASLRRRWSVVTRFRAVALPLGVGGLRRLASDAIMGDFRRDRSAGRWGRDARFGATVSLLLMVGGCGGRDSAPPGSTFGGEVTAIAPVLETCAQMAYAPAGRWCQSMHDRIAGCEHFLAVCPAGIGCTVTSAVQCAGPRQVESVCGSAAPAWFLRHVATAGWEVEIRGPAATAGRVAVTVEIRNPERADWARWLPAMEAPGGVLLSRNGAFAHLRYRPAGGLGISSRIAEQSLADRIFSLKSDLFTAAVLAGNVELAIYMPDGEQRIPPVALALDFKLRQPAIRAMEGFIEDLRRRYPLTRVDFELDGNSGACLANLRVLPELAPCYVATDRALVVGWNPASLRWALASVPLGDGSASRVDFDFLGFAEADRRLASAHGRAGAPGLVYPWRSMRITGGRNSNTATFAIELESGGTP